MISARARQEWRQLARDPVLLSSVALIFALLALFVVYPLLKVLWISLTPKQGFSLELYRRYFRESASYRPFWNSLLLGALVAAGGTGIGYFAAFALSRIRVAGSRLFRPLFTLTMISPPFVLALSAIMLFGRNGWITTRVLSATTTLSIYGLPGLVLVETLAYFPIAFLLLLGVLQSLDPNLEEAAQDLGASRFKVFTSVTLPLSMPGILSSLLLIFLTSIADFGNPLILSGDFQVLSVQAFLKITGEYDLPGGAAVAAVLLVPALLAFVVQRRLISRKSFVTVTGKPSPARLLPASPLTRAGFFLACLALAFAILLFYGMIGFGSFTRLWGADSTLTLANYARTFRMSWDYIRDSLILAGIATPFSGVLGILIAYLVVRQRFPGRSVMEFTSLLTYAVPGTVVGIGYLLAFNSKPLLLTGTAAIIILLNVFRNAPLGVRAGIASLAQIDPSLDEASADLGATASQTFRKVTLPLVAPAFYSGLGFSFIHCMTTISAVIFVVSGDWNLITVAILGLVENADLSQAAALSVILIALVFAALFLIRFIVGRFEAELFLEPS